jgi:hypothetical protein
MEKCIDSAKPVLTMGSWLWNLQGMNVCLRLCVLCCVVCRSGKGFAKHPARRPKSSVTCLIYSWYKNRFKSEQGRLIHGSRKSSITVSLWPSAHKESECPLTTVVVCSVASVCRAMFQLKPEEWTDKPLQPTYLDMCDCTEIEQCWCIYRPSCIRGRS